MNKIIVGDRGSGKTTYLADWVREDPDNHIIAVSTRMDRDRVIKEFDLDKLSVITYDEIANPLGVRTKKMVDPRDIKIAIDNLDIYLTNLSKSFYIDLATISTENMINLSFPTLEDCGDDVDDLILPEDPVSKSAAITFLVSSILNDLDIVKTVAENFSMDPTNGDYIYDRLEMISDLAEEVRMLAAVSFKSRVIDTKLYEDFCFDEFDSEFGSSEGDDGLSA